MVNAQVHLLRQYAINQRRLERREGRADSKPKESVRATLNQLAQGRRVRQIITKVSENNLCQAATINPRLTRFFMKALRGLNSLAIPVNSLEIKGSIARIENREILASLGEPGFLFRLLDEEGHLKVGRPGLLKNKVQVIDVCPIFKPLTIEDYSQVLLGVSGVFEHDQELGKLFLFKAVLRARIDLYIAGETRSAAVHRGERPGQTAGLERVRTFLDLLADKFPFEGTAEQQKIKAGLTRASELLANKNNPAADTKLNYLFQEMGKVVRREVVERTRPRKNEPKVHYLGEGCWEINTTGYRRTVAGISRKVRTKSEVHTPELLSLIQHEIDSNRAESGKNSVFLRDLEELQRTVPDNYDRLLEILEAFQAYEALSKDKACSELEGACQLVPIGTDQARSLAKELLGMALEDIRSRQKEVAGHESRFVRLYAETELLVGKKLNDFIKEIVHALSGKISLSKPDYLIKLADRVGAYLGNMLKGDMREPWLRRVKSRFAGLARVLRKLEKEVERKSDLLRALDGRRKEFVKERAKIETSELSKTEQKVAIKVAQQQALQKGRQDLAEINRIDHELAAQLIKAAKFLLLAELDFNNRFGGKIDKKAEVAFFAAKAKELSGVEGLLSGRVEALSRNGEPMGELGWRDADQLGLNYRPLK